MNKNTFHCHKCLKEHEVYDFVKENGKHQLRYMCGGIQRMGRDKCGNEAVQSITVELPYKGPELPGPFREVWSHGFAEAQRGKNQMQLILMK